jgi:hypothetical protein
MFFVWYVLPHFQIRSPIWSYWASIIGPIPFGIIAAKLIEIPVLHFRDRVFPTVPKQASAQGLGETPLDSVATS